MHREGTKNYYYVSASETIWKQLAEFINNIYGLVQEISNKDCTKVMQKGKGRNNYGYF